MSTSCPTCNQVITTQAPTYPVKCLKCGVEYGTAMSHRPDSDSCLIRQRDSAKREAKRYETAFNELHKKYEAQTKTHEELALALNRGVEDSKERVETVIKNYENWVKSRSHNLLTKRVVTWANGILGTKLVESRWERVMRVLEEAIELAQAEKITREEAEMLMQYVYMRPIGTIENEAGGVMVCMIAWAHTAKVDLELLLSNEVDRIEKLDPKHVLDKQRMKVQNRIGLEPDVSTA